MFLLEFDDLCYNGKSMEIKLPRRGLKLDKRANYPNHVRFDCHYHEDGINVTLFRQNKSFGSIDLFGIEIEEDIVLQMRVFDPEQEAVPDFNSTIYVYMGVNCEHAPNDTTEVIIHRSVKIIRKHAFYGCNNLRRVTMHDQVETIEGEAFRHCHLLDALFFPSSLKKIGIGAFSYCGQMKILSIPQNIDIWEIGNEIITHCPTFFRTTRIKTYNEHDYFADDQVCRELINFHRSLPPLLKSCLDMNVSAQSICQCIAVHGPTTAFNKDYGDGMTPMHVLALNPHATTGSILTLFHANMGAVFERDSVEKDKYYRVTPRGRTPLDYLGYYDVESYLVVVAALCKHREEHMD